jgi:hypothetical protein
MKESKYIIKTELELHIHLTISEKCLETAKNGKFDTEVIWCEYIRNFIISGNKGSIEKIIFELDSIYVRLENLYALSINEATSYLLIFFKNRLWNKTFHVVKANNKCFGKHFHMDNT